MTHKHDWKPLPKPEWAVYQYWRCATCDKLRLETGAERDARIHREMAEAE